MMRVMSSRSSISCACARALRSMASSPLARSSSAWRRAAQQDLRPAEDGVERRAQLVRERGEELVLHPVDPLRLGARHALALEQALALGHQQARLSDVDSGNSKSDHFSRLVAQRLDRHVVGFGLSICP